MKIYVFAVAFLFAKGMELMAQRADLTLTDGTVLKEALIVAVSDEGVVINSSSGSRTFPRDKIPLDVLARAAIELRQVPVSPAPIATAPAGAGEAVATEAGPSVQSSAGGAPATVVPTSTSVVGSAPASPLPEEAGSSSKQEKLQAASTQYAQNSHPALLYGTTALAGAACILLLALLLRNRAFKKKELELHELKLQHQKTAGALAQLRERFGNVMDLDQERERIMSEIDDLRKRLGSVASETRNSEAALEALRKTLALYQDDLQLADFGVYKKHYDFDISQRFKDAIDAVRARQKEMIKDGAAFICDKEWVVEGSRSEGQRMIKKYEKLMLRAFNGESDAIISDVTWSNSSRVEARLDASFDAINKLGESYSCRVSRDYVKLKLDELRLTYEYKEKVRAEKEEQRRIQEQIREEERAQREIERALRDAEDEEVRYQKALERARAELSTVSGEEIEKQKRKIAHLEQQLKEAHENRERAVSRAQLTKSGHVYIISNIGSFGENKFKIGMTRRLDPMERVRELGDASVPFDFDVHAVIYTEDAPGFENRLHQHFAAHRVNKVNERKEFFNVSIEEIEAAVRKLNAKIELIKVPEARDYRQTLALRGEKPRWN